MNVVGLDLGGANLKGADRHGLAVSIPFPIWKHPHELTARLRELIARFETPRLIVATMTAELADCFATKREGVERIVHDLQMACEGIPIMLWQTGGEFVAPDEALAIPELVAAANWHALATWVGRIAPRGNALLFDVGSTTADLIPLEEGLPVPEGRTDPERLLSSELVYTGVRRTPICAVVRTLPYRGGDCPVAAELFATTLDAWLLLGEIAEEPDNCETANGRPATRVEACRRLSRMVCGDETDVDEDECRAMAKFVGDSQVEHLRRAVERVAGRLRGDCGTVILSGEGEFLARRTLATLPRFAKSEFVMLGKILNERIAAAACAHALAQLAAERIQIQTGERNS